MQRRQDKTSRRKFMYHLVDGHTGAAQRKRMDLHLSLTRKVEGLVDGGIMTD